MWLFKVKKRMNLLLRINHDKAVNKILRQKKKRCLIVTTNVFVKQCTGIATPPPPPPTLRPLLPLSTEKIIIVIVIIVTGGTIRLLGRDPFNQKFPNGSTGKSGPPQKVDQFFRNFSGWTEPIHWVLDRNFRIFWLNGSRPWFPLFCASNNHDSCKRYKIS